MLIKLDEDAYQEVLKIKENPDSIDSANTDHTILIEGRFIVNSNELEINKIILATLSQRFNSDKLSLTIAPTRACNFNCSYCYENDRANEKMSKKVQTGIIEFAKRYNHLSSINVTWYGGEPTLEIMAMQNISKGLQSVSTQYSAFMVTNGYRLDKIIDYLDELRIVGLQITLDGTRESHNKTRPLRNGRETFDKVVSNMEKLVNSHNINISVRMNINKENADKYIELYRFLKQKFDNKVHLYPAFVHDYSGSSCKADSCYDDSYSKAIFLKSLFYKYGLYTKDIYPFRNSKGCMCQGLNSFLVGTHGELYKCWHHLGNKELIVGDIFNSQIFTNQDCLADLMIRGDVLSNKECISCILFPSCNGGCSDLRRLNENVCIPAKSALEDFLEIHYTVKETTNDKHAKSFI
jgi:uncharacterized protein